jgi:hypothetical protein
MLVEIYNQNWLVLDVKIQLRQFLMRFKSISKFYRYLIQSEYRLSGLSNRIFFKNNFRHGFYRIVIANEVVRIIFILEMNQPNKQSNLELQLKIRTRKLINCHVSIYPTSDLSNTDKILLGHSENSVFKSFGLSGYRN